MDDYICKNPNCGETWEVNSEHGLVPGLINSGYWLQSSEIELENCPACAVEESEDWKWVRTYVF